MTDIQQVVPSARPASARAAGRGFHAYSAKHLDQLVQRAGLPADERCTLVVMSAAGRGVAGTWSAKYDGTAQVEGTAAIPVRQLTALRIEAPGHRLLLSIPV